MELSDVGTGVSQVLPVVAACCIHNQQWVVIEHPELHLHPRAQCALADVFLQQQGPRLPIMNSGNSFFLETHSEHFLLRLLRRVREATRLRYDAPQPCDLSVVYVRQTAKGAMASAMLVTEDGDFDEPWPEGFFEERESELF